jgi:hypothetical protein
MSHDRQSHRDNLLTKSGSNHELGIREFGKKFNHSSHHHRRSRGFR